MQRKVTIDKVKHVSPSRNPIFVFIFVFKYILAVGNKTFSAPIAEFTSLYLFCDRAMDTLNMRLSFGKSGPGIMQCKQYKYR